MKQNHFLQALSFSTLALSGIASANSIQGQITDNQGKTLEFAEVEIIDTKKTVKADEQGRFLIDDLKPGHYELHLSAKNHAHKNIHLDVPKQGIKNLQVRLTPSSIEVIDVTASPYHGSQIETAQPVSVLSGEQLKASQATTLGDTLKYQVGVHSSFYGSVASSPIIRGLDGPRVLVTQNGLDVGDVSRIGPDHAVATSATSAEQIEVLRGPATLFFGSGAIGGVVNVVDKRIPKDSVTEGQWQLEYNSVDQQKLASVSAKSGTEHFAYYLDAFASESENYQIPDYRIEEDEHDEHEEEAGHEESAEHHDEILDEVDNSQSKSSGFTLGSSYLFDTHVANGFVGLSYGYLDREYGIPGHEHAHSEEETAVDDDTGVQADMRQHRVQMLSEINIAEQFFNQINLRAGYTDYQHEEIEAGEVATRFSSEASEARAELLHRAVNDWRGGINLHYKQQKQVASGEEAFTPPSKTTELAVAVMEEKHFGNWLVQLGARAEHIEIESHADFAHEVDLHSITDGHDETEEHDEHEAHQDEHQAAQETEFDSLDFNPLSWSMGVVWDFTPGYNIALSFASSQRAPSAAELYSFGPHLAANTYEIGGLYELHEEEGEIHIELSESSVKLEKSNNLDLSLRKFEGDFGFLFNLFYNQVDNYYYQTHTGFETALHAEHEDESAHPEEDHIEDEHEAHEAGMIPVYLFTTADAKLYGYEAEVFWRYSNALQFKLQSDLVRATLVDSNGDLPRTPPMRVGASANYQADNYSLDMSVHHYFEQDKTEAYETQTDAYTVMDLNANYYLSGFGQDLVLYLKAQNLTNELGLVHTSFLKQKAPLPGRNIGVGIRGYF